MDDILLDLYNVPLIRGRVWIRKIVVCPRKRGRCIWMQGCKVVDGTWFID